MNRQFRRANEKSDKKREREKTRRKVGAYAGRAPAKKERPKSAKPDAKDAKTTQGSEAARRRSDFRTSGRFTGIMALVTTVLILMGAFFRAPDPDPTVLTVVSEASLFLFFGYFIALWLLRTNVARALAVTVTSGIVLATVVEGAQFFLETGTPDPLMVLLAAPLVVVGAFLGRFIYQKVGVSQ